MIRIILVRHGLTAWNVGEGPGRRFRGTVDLPLAEEGVTQAQITARQLAHLSLYAVYTSPLQRAVRTAEIIAEPHGVEPQSLPGLGSMSYGEWAGKTSAEVARRWPELYRRWRRDPFGVQLPGGETAQALRLRAVAAIQQVVARHEDGATVVLVSHQITNKALVCSLLSLPNSAFWWIRQGLCNLTRFDYDPSNGHFSLAGLNDECHLIPALPAVRGEGTRLILVRHGQTAWNEGAGQERFRGRTDLPLDDTGRAQAEAVARRLDGEPIAAVYASPLQRARQTAAPLAEKLGLPVQSHEGLLDIHYGQLQGLTYAEAATAHPDLIRQWHLAPGQARFPGGEGLDSVQVRLLSFLDEISSCHPGQTVMAVGHQIVNKVLACTLLWSGGSAERADALDQIWRIGQDTASVNVFGRVSDAWHTLCLNDTCHLLSE